MVAGAGAVVVVGVDEVASAPAVDDAFELPAAGVGLVDVDGAAVEASVVEGFVAVD